MHNYKLYSRCSRKLGTVRTGMMARRAGLIGVFFLVFFFTFQLACVEAAPLASLVPKAAPQGWAFPDSPETFTKETLFEHIDGQADLFIQYGFQESVFTMCRNTSSAEDKIDVDIYDMGSVLQAFGVFSRFRQEEGSAGIGLESYLEDRSVFFYKGKYFVVLQATESNPLILKGLAREIASRISDDAAPPKEISSFPRSGLKPGSIEYFPDGLLGHEFLKRGFKASYIEKDDPKSNAKESAQSEDPCLFLAMFEHAQEAAHALSLYKAHLAEKGSAAKASATTLGPGAVTGVDPYQGRTVVAQSGPYLVGAVGFQHDGEGEQRVAELIKALQ